MIDETEQGALFEEPEQVPPLRDGAWQVSPSRWRYLLLGEDSETLMVAGHVDDVAVREVLSHAGMYWEDDDGPVPVEYSWAVELDRCPHWTHRWLRVVVKPGEWVRYQVFRVLWRLWWSKDPLRQWWRPRWLTWMQRRWNGFVHCDTCEWVAATTDPFWMWGDDWRRRGEPVTLVELEV